MEGMKSCSGYGGASCRWYCAFRGSLSFSDSSNINDLVSQLGMGIKSEGKPVLQEVPNKPSANRKLPMHANKLAKLAASQFF